MRLQTILVGMFALVVACFASSVEVLTCGPMTTACDQVQNSIVSGTMVAMATVTITVTDCGATGIITATTESSVVVITPTASTDVGTTPILTASLVPSTGSVTPSSVGISSTLTESSTIESTSTTSIESTSTESTLTTPTPTGSAPKESATNGGAGIITPRLGLMLAGVAVIVGLI